MATCVASVEAEEALLQIYALQVSDAHCTALQCIISLTY